MKKLLCLLAALIITTPAFAKGPVYLDPEVLPAHYRAEDHWYRGFFGSISGCAQKSSADYDKKLRGVSVWTPEAFVNSWGAASELNVIFEDNYVIIVKKGTWDVLAVFSESWENCMQGLIDYKLITR